MSESPDRRRRNKQRRTAPRELRIGATAVCGTTRLRSDQVGALPLLNHYFERLELRQLLRRHLPTADARRTIASELLILLLVRNVLVSREPLYGMPEFLALLVQSLIERDLRAALVESGTKAAPEYRHDEGSIDVYPEGRRTRRQTARFVLDLLEDLRCHELSRGNQPRDAEPMILHDELNPTQDRVLTLLESDPASYGK